MKHTGVGKIGSSDHRIGPEFIRDAIVSIAQHTSLKEQLEALKRKQPLAAKNLSMAAFKKRKDREGWGKLASKMKEEAMQEALAAARDVRAEVTKDAISAENDLSGTLVQQLKQLNDKLNAREPGTIEHERILEAIRKVTTLIGKYADTDRLRKQEELTDRAAVQMRLLEEKQKLKDGELTTGNDLKKDITILDEDEEEL